MREYELDLNSFEKWLKTQGASERTIKTYIDNMNAYARKFETFSYANNRELVETSIETEKSASTINSQTSAMNSLNLSVRLTHDIQTAGKVRKPKNNRSRRDI